MAPGQALTLPRLAAGALDPVQPRTAYSGAFGLARNLLLAGIGLPEDWERSKDDPIAFMLRTVERSAAGFNRKAIDGVAHVDILFGTSPYISSWHEKEYENPDRVFLAVEATHISIVSPTYSRAPREGASAIAGDLLSPPARRRMPVDTLL